ncbi:MAG: ACP S-malonyltransferase [Acidobacteria bacterium]|nr:ACP S-malonyltransferase [Acidobacteriota bacterium]
MEMPSDTLALFPGQGAIQPGAGREWQSDEAWELVEVAHSLTGVDLHHLLLTANEDELVRTDNAQLATFVLSLMSFRAYCRNCATPTIYVGHSLGEFSALTASGVLSYTEGLQLVASRGAAMMKASQSTPGAMAALMGGSGDVTKILERGDVWLANINGEDQLVVAGTVEGIESLEQNIHLYGWKRCRRLKVGGAFHSPLMQPAVAEFAEALSRVSFLPSPFRVFSNVDGEAHSEESDWRELSLRQLTEPVQFVACVSNAAKYANEAVEFHPSGVLRGLVKRIAPSLAVQEFSRGAL